MDTNKVEKLMKDCDTELKYVQTISDTIIKEKTKDLDELMRDIQENVVIKDDASDLTVRKYFLELTNAIYFINTHCEFLGFYDDLAKTKAKMAYNNAFTKSQFDAVSTGTKKTVAEHTIEAESKCIDENVVSLIYSRSYKIIRSKIEAAYEMARCLSKILSLSMSEKQLNSGGYIPEPSNKENF